jgi:REP element-mobilizing transposase RayT
VEKFQNKYRIQSARLPDWDYGSNGLYFITICTRNRECFFGDVIDGEMQLSEIGNLAKQYLLEIPKRFPYMDLDEFVIMPNHVHAILVVDKTGDDADDRDRNDLDNNDGDCRDAIHRVSTAAPSTSDVPNPKQPGGITGDKNPMLHDNISNVLNWYTGRVTFESRKIDKNFGWQARFHDHILRDDDEYQRIKKYIIENPGNWYNDLLFE